MKIPIEELPPRIILSRKGSDSAWGGQSSLLINETKLISLPIPESSKLFPPGKDAENHLRYENLPEHQEIGAFSKHLPKVSASTFVHLDPDIRPELRSENANCDELLFGQTGKAQSHLENHGVGRESLFLFFGWFQSAEYIAGEWKRMPPNEHIIWGWFQVEDIFPVENREQAAAVVAKLKCAKHHPHVSDWERYGAKNRLYRAKKSLSFAPELPGAGVFDWREPLTLTERCTKETTRRNWCVPAVLAKTGLTHHRIRENHVSCTSSPERVHFKSACIGQEFVMPAENRDFTPDERGEIALWLQQIFGGVK